MTESIKALEIKTSVLFNSDFVNTTILSCYFLLLISAIIAQIFNPIPELVIPLGIPITETKE